MRQYPTPGLYGSWGAWNASQQLLAACAAPLEVCSTQRRGMKGVRWRWIMRARSAAATAVAAATVIKTAAMPQS